LANNLNYLQKFIEQQLKETFKDKTSFTKEDLAHFFRRYEAELNERTFYSRIRALKIKNIITQLNRNTYTLYTKKEFTPDIDKELGELGLLIIDFLVKTPYCIWDSGWINQFSRHQAVKNIHIVETSKPELLSLFHFLKDNGWENAFINPGQEILYLYTRENEVPIVLKPLISRSPVVGKEYISKKLAVPSLEKVLVDLYTDVFIFNYIQGAELETIFEKAISRYAINFTTLFAYARRRNKEQQIKAYLKTHFAHLLTSIGL
jgi:hypothetical protein